MIDLFAVINFSGLIYWTFTSHSFDHIFLINSLLLSIENEGNPNLTLTSVSDENAVIIGNYQLKWIRNEGLSLIFIVAYPKMFPIDWSGRLLNKMSSFIQKEFTFEDTNHQYDSPLCSDSEKVLVQFKEFVRREEKGAALEAGKNNNKNNNSNEKNVKNNKKNSSSTSKEANTKTKTKTKNTNVTQRSWNDKTSRSEMASLDYSTVEPSSSSSFHEVETKNDLNEKSHLDDSSEEEEDYSEEDDESGDKNTTASTLWESFKTLTGSKPLTAADLEPALKTMKLHLIGKNVASDTADVVAKAVGKRLEGTTLRTFSSVAKMVKESTRQIIESILTPHQPIDLLNEIKSDHHRKKKRPFVVAFIGVNGVGKSTNLSKVAYWLLQHNLKVLMVAADTFRAGAVEQLNHHVKNLNKMVEGRVEIYQRGYGRDAAQIAQDGIKYGESHGFDVVLIDTAGRMQDNGPLMLALAKLVSLTVPDRVIFVGEALVGHNALSQLTKFNTTLLDRSAKPIDGILLSKVDTIDDKIGAALSMTVTAKAPILFIGVGQTYTDLKKINVKTVVDLLLK